MKTNTSKLSLRLICLLPLLNLSLAARAQYSPEDEEAIAKDAKTWREEHVKTAEESERFRAYRIQKLVEQKDLAEKKEAAPACDPEGKKAKAVPSGSRSWFGSRLEGIAEMLAHKERLNELHFPSLLKELALDDYDLLVISIGAGSQLSHQRPKGLVREAVAEGKKVKIINLDPYFEGQKDVSESNLSLTYYPLLFPGHDGSGFFPRATRFDQKILDAVDMAIEKARDKSKKVVIMSGASGYPQDTVIALWQKWKNSRALMLVQSYETTPTVVFNPTQKDFPARSLMMKFVRDHFKVGERDLKKLASGKYKDLGKFFFSADNIGLVDFDHP